MTIKTESISTKEYPNFFLFHLENDAMKVTLTNYGCTVISIEVPDRNGKCENITAGFSDPFSYLGAHPYFGCVVGRYANRIAQGTFSLMDHTYKLPTNNGANHLHGGIEGFNRKFWDITTTFQTEDSVGVSFSYYSAHGEEGYPGNLTVHVTYRLTVSNELIIQYQAQTDQPTIINLTNHSYFNLTGFNNPTIYQHQLKVNAEAYTVKNSNNTPSGEICSVTDTPFDFTDFKPIEQHLHVLTNDKGYDINFVLNSKSQRNRLAASLYESHSGRFLQVFTTKPGIQVYTANWWDGTIHGAQGKPYAQHGAIALETQHFPDAPNHAHFPSAVLLPNELYETETTYQFSIK